MEALGGLGPTQSRLSFRTCEQSLEKPRLHIPDRSERAGFKVVQSLNKVAQDLRDEVLRRSEIVEPWQSYWYNRPLRNFPPPSIVYPSEYDGSEKLSLACTQTDLPSKKQRELVQEWCHLLPTLTNVRIVWIHTKVTQELFEAVCGMTSLKGLYIKWSSINDLEPIRSLRRLTHLHIGGAPSAEPIDALCDLVQLVDLELQNVRAASQIEFLEKMPQLRSLDLSGDWNSSKSLAISSLAPLRALVNLERLAISTATIADKSLQPIAELPQLKLLLLSNQFEMEEIAKLAGRLPNVDCDRFTPIGAIAEWNKCKKCGGQTMVPLTGKRKPWLCTTCDAVRIEKHVSEFNRVSAQAAAGT